jgi:hydrogenase nickel incorporation protein HypB
MPVTTIHVRERVMERNNRIAGSVREKLRAAGVPALNLISSPGAGKTMLLERTLEAFGAELTIALIAGDCQTDNDAQRLALHTDRLVQAVVTDGACHMDAAQVEQALESIDLAGTDLVIIENVGNLVCPASWDLGEEAKVVLFSVTEGEDKPVKYPNTFRRAGYVVLTKLDLLPHVDFDLERAVAYAHEVNPGVRLFFTSARSGEGMSNWLHFLRERAAAARDRTLAGV